jgi:hypothetical protein
MLFHMQHIASINSGKFVHVTYLSPVLLQLHIYSEIFVTPLEENFSLLYLLIYLFAKNGFES